jgi:hypothetical protein
MIRVSDFMPLAAAGARPLSSSPRAAEALNPSSWFDGDGLSAGARIGVDLGAASRGLSVAQHAERVLAHLCGPDEAL